MGIRIVVDTTDKKFMFVLGKMFARGDKIKILNINEVNKKIEQEKKLRFAKSFNMMIKYWQDNGVAPNIFTESKKENGLFLICPVRNATDDEKQKLNNILKKYEEQGYVVHYPARDTNQNPNLEGVNTGGFNICLQNAKAMASSNTVAIFYNKDSVGSMFDLGVAYELQQRDKSRKFILDNEFDYDENNYIDNIIMKLSKTNEVKK